MTTLAYSETAIRAALKTVIETVTGSTRVYDTQRLLTNTTALHEAFLDTDNNVLNGWEISLSRMVPTLLTFAGGGLTGTMQMDYFYDVVGWYAANDENQTEKIVAALAIEVFDAIMSESSLTGKTLERESPLVTDINLEYRLFGGVLCHRIHLVVNPQEELI